MPCGIHVELSIVIFIHLKVCPTDATQLQMGEKLTILRTNMQQMTFERHLSSHCYRGYVDCKPYSAL